MDLINSRFLIAMHEDLDIYAYVAVGFDEKLNLVVEYAVDNANNKEQSKRTWFVIDRKNTMLLADKVRSHIIDMPDFFNKKFGTEPLNDSADYREVVATKDAIYSYLNSMNVKYKVAFKPY